MKRIDLQQLTTQALVRRFRELALRKSKLLLDSNVRCKSGLR